MSETALKVEDKVLILNKISLITWIIIKLFNQVKSGKSNAFIKCEWLISLHMNFEYIIYTVEIIYIFNIDINYSTFFYEGIQPRVHF